MASIRDRIVTLESVARRAEKTLKIISRASTNAAKLRTGAIAGGIGFLVGAGGTFSVLAAASSLIYAPVLVPTVGLCGLFIGILIKRDDLDRANERAVELVERAWELRDKEVRKLNEQIKIAQRSKSPRVQLLEKKVTALQLAPPERLLEYYGLSDKRRSEKQREHPLLGPAEAEIHEAWKPRSPRLQDLRQDPEDE